MAIALLGTPTGGGLAAAGTSVTATVPTAAQGVTSSTTLLLLTLSGNATAVASVATPAGWSVWQANTLSGTVFESVTFSRFASAEPTSYTVSGLTSGRWAWNVRVYSGVDGTTPKDVAVTNAVSTTGTPTPAAITPVTSGAWVDCTNSVVTASGVTTTTWTSSNMTKDTDWTSTAGATTNAAGGTAHFAWTSGAFSPNLTQVTSTAARGVSFTSALRPAAGAAAAPFELLTPTPRYY